MKKLLASSVALFCAASVHAAPVAGFSDFTDNGGGSFTFVFDTLGADINDVGEGLSFTNGSGLDFVATATGGPVIQDYPAHGGLGVDGDPDGDNLGVGEFLTLAFNQTISLLGFTLNDGHQDAASGDFTLNSSGGPAHLFDGVGNENPYQGQICAATFLFCNINALTFGSIGANGFTGYVESVTVQVSAVPLPASLGFLFAGLGGLGIAGRRRRKT